MGIQKEPTEAEENPCVEKILMSAVLSVIQINIKFNYVHVICISRNYYLKNSAVSQSKLENGFCLKQGQKAFVAQGEAQRIMLEVGAFSRVWLRVTVGI